MARSDIVTLLALDRYAKIMGIWAPHFNQLGGNKAPVETGCQDAIWDQDDRDTLAWTMQQAEEMIAEFLHFYPSPKFVTDEEIFFGLSGVRSDWIHAEVGLNWGYLDCLGTEELTLKQAGASVIYTNDDNDPDGREELATISGSGLYVEDLAACDSGCEVAVFFREADGAEDSADPRWEIRNLKVDIDGGTMSITGEASEFVKPDLWKLTKANSTIQQNDQAYIVNYDTSNFVSQVDVYCRSINQATPVTLRWDGICNCTSPCSHNTQTACGWQTNKKRGYFAPRPATWNGTSHVWAAPSYAWAPATITANYRAGLPLDRNCQMNANMERAIVKLTNSLMPHPPCGFCSDLAKHRWDNDRKQIDPLTPEAASMPWDVYTIGALEAWRIVKLFSRGRGIKMGR